MVSPKAVLRLMEQRRIRNHTTDEIFDELRRVVAYPKLKFPPALQVKILEFVFCWSTFVQDVEPVAAVASDPDDDKFIACAIAAGASHVISGDIIHNPFRRELAFKKQRLGVSSGDAIEWR